MSYMVENALLRMTEGASLSLKSSSPSSSYSEQVGMSDCPITELSLSKSDRYLLPFRVSMLAKL